MIINHHIQHQHINQYIIIMNGTDNEVATININYGVFGVCLWENNDNEIISGMPMYIWFFFVIVNFFCFLFLLYTPYCCWWYCTIKKVLFFCVWCFNLLQYTVGILTTNNAQNYYVSGYESKCMLIFDMFAALFDVSLQTVVYLQLHQRLRY